MNPGRLNQRIEIYRRALEQDDYGAPAEKQELVHKCWAAVRNKSGREQFMASTPFAKTVTSFLIRYIKAKIDTTMTIEFKGDSYNIIYIDNYNYSNEYIELIAEKVI